MSALSTRARWLMTAAFFVVALASLAFGVDSQGARGVVFGLLMPGCCVAGVSAMQGLLPAFVVAAGAWLLSLRLASRVGNNVHGDVINLWPFLVAAGLLLAGCLGLFLRLAAESIHDRRSGLV